MLSGCLQGGARLGPAGTRHSAASCGDRSVRRSSRVQAVVRSIEHNSQLLQLQQLQAGQCAAVCVTEDAHTTRGQLQQQDQLQHHPAGVDQHRETGLFPAGVQQEHVQHLLLQQQQLHHAVLQQQVQQPAWASADPGTQPGQLLAGHTQQQQHVGHDLSQQQQHCMQLAAPPLPANGHSLPHTTHLQLDSTPAVLPEQSSHSAVPSKAQQQQPRQHRLVQQAAVQQQQQQQQQQAVQRGQQAANRQQQGSLKLPSYGLLVRPQQQQRRSLDQPSSPSKQRHTPGSPRGPVFRVANHTRPKDLAHSLELWLRQHEQQQRAQAAAAAAQVPGILLCCSSKAALHISLEGVARAALHMSRLQQPYQLLLQPKLREQSVAVSGPAADGSRQQQLAEYQLRVAFVPMQPVGQSGPQQQQQPEDPQQLLPQQQQQQQPVDVPTPQHLPQHCKLLQCDHLASPVPDSSTSSSSRSRKKQQQSRALKQGSADAAEGLPDSSSSSPQTALCPPAKSLRHLQSQVVGHVQGRWPTGMCVSTAVGALAAFKALVQARGQLAASGCDLFLSPQLTQPLDAACPFVGGSTGSSSNGQEGCCSSSAVVLWAVAVPAAPADALPANIGPVLAAQSHKQHAKQQQQQQQQPKQPRQQQLRQQQQPMQPLEPQAAAQTHAMTHTPSLQQQQQVHTAAAPSGVCLPVALPPLQHCTPSTHGLRANGNGNSKLCEIVQLPEQLQPC